MYKQKLLEEINAYIKSVKKEPYDNPAETEGFLNAMKIAKELIEKLSDTDFKKAFEEQIAHSCKLAKELAKIQAEKKEGGTNGSN